MKKIYKLVILLTLIIFTGCEYIVGNLAGEDLMPPSNSYFRIQGYYNGKDIDIETKYPVINKDNPPFLILAVNVEKLGFDFSTLGLQIDTTGLVAGSYMFTDGIFSIKAETGEDLSSGSLDIDEYNSKKVEGIFYSLGTTLYTGDMAGEFYIEFDDPY